jgi:hypothetical protein
MVRAPPLCFSPALDGRGARRRVESSAASDADLDLELGGNVGSTWPLRRLAGNRHQRERNGLYDERDKLWNERTGRVGHRCQDWRSRSSALLIGGLVGVIGASYS